MVILHVHYELAQYERDGVVCDGVVCKKFHPEDSRLVLGNELLSKVIPGYYEEDQWKQRNYTLWRVLSCLDNDLYRVPLGFMPTASMQNPLGVFVGYLLFDAWIANQDRHHENWGFVLMKDGSIHLAPSYDHASSMGRVVDDVKKMERLNTKNSEYHISSYAQKAMTKFYRTPNDAKPMTTIEVFREAAGRNRAAAQEWVERLARVSDDATLHILKRVPRAMLSEVGVDFAHELLRLNRIRLLKAFEEVQ